MTERFSHLSDDELRAKTAEALDNAHNAPKHPDAAGKLGYRWAELKDEMIRRGLK